MTQRQLANVLLKISGITGLIHALPMLTITTISYATTPSKSSAYSTGWADWIMPISALSSIIICTTLILYSEKISAKFFRAE